MRSLRAKAQAILCDALWLTLPYQSMGKVDTLDLFAPKELELLALYDALSYRRVADIGANVGLHAQWMAAKCGWQVEAYEPDPEIFQQLERNTAGLQVFCHNAAVSDQSGEAAFVRVMNNRTGSHLQGMKSPYGPLQEIRVQTLDARTVLRDVEFAKIDAEGSEWAILSRLEGDTDFVTEITSPEIAAKVFDRFHDRFIYAQQRGWDRIFSADDMPVKHQDGAVYVRHAAWL